MLIGRSSSTLGILCTQAGYRGSSNPDTDGHRDQLTASTRKSEKFQPNTAVDWMPTVNAQPGFRSVALKHVVTQQVPPPWSRCRLPQSSSAALFSTSEQRFKPARSPPVQFRDMYVVDGGKSVDGGGMRNLERAMARRVEPLMHATRGRVD